MEDNKINMYYFNHKLTSPIVFFIIQVYSDEDVKLIEDHTQFFFETLINNKLADSSNILVFNIIKQHYEKMINWILPSTNSNNKIIKQLGDDPRVINTIIGETIKNSNCNTLLSFNRDELKIQDTKINLDYLYKLYN